MSPQKLTKDMVERAEALASRIVGISSCKITTDETGEITEIHVVATSKKPAKLIARDVESCLKAELGISVDHKKIGVVLFEQAADSHTEYDKPAPTAEEESIEEFPVEEFPPRFIFQSVNLFISESNVKAEVELTRDGMEAFGSAQSEQGSTSNLHVIAEATLKSVSEFLNETIKLRLCDIVQVPLGDKKVVIVGIDLIRGRDRKSLAGCCIVTSDEAQTAVFATLDAVNRVVGKLQPKSSIEYRIQ
jgi:hypothetical protein